MAKRNNASDVMTPSNAIIPIITGNAPGIAPTITATVLYLFSGVYKKAYVTNESVPKKEVNGFNKASRIIPNKLASPASTSADDEDHLPAARGRLAVRSINLS